ncbi:MAG: hypothetical protein ACO3LO_07320, partial [Ilumatobacteraceae bacterium]
MSSIDASSNSAGVSPSESSTSVPLGQALALWSLGWSIGGIVLGGAIYAIAPSDGGTGTVTLAVMATASWTCLIASLLVAGRLQGVGLRALVALRVRWIDLAGIPIGTPQSDDMRITSSFIARLAAARRDYELVCYARLDDI